MAFTQRRLEFSGAHWVDAAGATRADLEALGKEYGLIPNMIQDCLDPDHLPKFQRSGSGGFLMLRAFDESSADECTSVQECTRKVAIFWGENFLLTIHRAPMDWIDGIWTNWERRPQREATQLAALVHDLVEECLFTFEAPIDRAGLAMEKMEDTIFRQGMSATTSNEILEVAYLAKKRATLFKRMLRLSRDLIPLLSRLGDPASPAVQSLKDEADRLFFYSDDLVETTHDLVQLSISLTSNRTNEVVRLLTLVSIFLMPLTFITGLYGMNFEFMPEIHWRHGYAFALALMFVIELAIFLVLKKKRWIR